jgi:hypothetical protein
MGRLLQHDCTALLPLRSRTDNRRFRAFPVQQFMSFISSPTRKSVGITKAALGMIQVDMMAPGFTPTGEYYLMPDLKSLRTSSLEPRYASLMGQFEEKFSEPKQVGLCPRTILSRIVRYFTPLPTVCVKLNAGG